MTRSTVLLPGLALAAILLAWEVWVRLAHIPPALLVPPSAVALTIGRQWPILVSEGWVTFVESFVGFVLAFAFAVPLAVVITASRTLNQALYPLLIATQSLPKVAVAPLILVWVGTGIESKLVIAWLVAFFPILVDTATGLRLTPPEFLELGRSLRASPWQVFSKFRLPSAVPFIVSGSKVAVTLALIGAVIGEFVSSTDGLGFLLLTANSQLDTALSFAALFGLAVLGLALYGMVAVVERLLVPIFGAGH